MRTQFKKMALAILAAASIAPAQAQSRQEHIINSDWKFAFGNAKSYQDNYMAGTGYFSWLAKTGYGDGPASPDFDDRPWRTVSLPHDWAAEMPFAPGASHSHGYKQVGWAYPESSLGWYRKTIDIPASDLGKRISLLFEGIYRNSEIWINGFYIGGEPSGYLDHQYDVTEYINYGGKNVIAVKADASMEEGWFYEGAGIYRNVWIIKTDPVHVGKDGIFATANISAASSDIDIRANILNDDFRARNVSISLSLRDAAGKKVAEAELPAFDMLSMTQHQFFKQLKVSGIKLWSPDAPNIYALEVRVSSDGKQVDAKTVNVGFRTMEFTSDKGFFLNGQPLKIIGANIHQDFAGVGCAVSKPLQIERVKMLKQWGFNAIRTSHNPVNVDLLDVCDSLGMLVLEEARLEGVSDFHKSQLRRMIERDRNHPSIMAWSVGNEEWKIEGNILGERITRAIQAYAKTIDSTRLITVAVSGGCGNGSSESIELMGFNYLAQCNIDQYHQSHLNQPGWLTEETSGCGARGIYWPDSSRCHIPQFDRAGGTSIERGFRFCMEREWMAGLFFWTGFDYRGESTPFSYPANGSYFGILDQCGFPKDAAFYIKACRSKSPVAHLLPHWNHPGHEGDTVEVWAYSNCDEAELILNKKSMGRQPVPKFGHCSWKVPYQPGDIQLKAYRNGALAATDEARTSGAPASISLSASKSSVARGKEDIVLVTVSALDSKGIQVPDASCKAELSISGPGEILGVGNGDPSCLESDREHPQAFGIKIIPRSELTLSSLDKWKSEVEASDSASWRKALYSSRSQKWYDYHDTLLAVRCSFDIAQWPHGAKFQLFSKSILLDQSIYINGHLVASAIKRDQPQAFSIDAAILKEGINEIIYVGQKIRKTYEWDEPNTDPGCVGVSAPAKPYSRSLFSGKALVLIKTSGKPGTVVLTAKSKGLRDARISIRQ